MCCWIDRTEPPVTLVSVAQAELKMSNIDELSKQAQVLDWLFCRDFVFIFGLSEY